MTSVYLVLIEKKDRPSDVWVFGNEKLAGDMYERELKVARVKNRGETIVPGGDIDEDCLNHVIVGDVSIKLLQRELVEY
jgi:hypothetical protein